MNALGLECTMQRRASALSLVVGALSLLLCSTGCTDVATDGTGGGGSAGSGGSGGSSGSGGGGAGGSGGSGLACDDGTVADINSSECSTCVACAAEGPCAADIQACEDSVACVGFGDCLNECSGVADFEACLQDCIDATTSDVVDLYLVAQNCPLCQECPNNCQTGGPSCESGSGGTGGGGGGVAPCSDDGICSAEDDCVCPECDDDLFCSDPGNCEDNGTCQTFEEGCVCVDCADLPVCVR